MIFIFDEHILIFDFFPYYLMFSYKHKCKELVSNEFRIILFDDEEIGAGSGGKCYMGYLPLEDKLVIVKRLDWRIKTNKSLH